MDNNYEKRRDQVIFADNNYMPIKSDEKRRERSSELLKSLRQFNEENGRPPKIKDFINNPKYPGYRTYYNYFGTWYNALKLAGLDMDAVINNKSELYNSNIKGRSFEMLIFKNFKESDAVDLSGKCCTSPYDGICPRGKIYDAKSSKLYTKGRLHWKFSFKNKKINNIDYFYLGGYDEHFGKLLFIWLMKRQIIGDKKVFRIYIDEMEKYKEFEINIPEA